MCTLGHFLAAGKCKSSQGLTLLTVRLYSDLILKALNVKESVVLKPKYSKLFIKKKYFQIEGIRENEGHV